jgi:peptidoglycan/LPS O-acetylase OafA/YrhL
MKRIPTLDGWRGIAILLVLVDHAILATRRNNAETTGQHGVTIFFVLSGFLITTRLMREKEETGRNDLRQFYIRRFFRLMPCAWGFLLFSLIPAMQSPERSGALANIISALFFFRNYAHLFASDFQLTGHFWSLSIEEQFYLAWPSLMIVLGMHKARWFAVAGAAAIAFYRFAHWSSIESQPPFFRDGTHIRADALLIGCAMALFLPSIRRWLRTWMAIPLLAGLVMCMMRYYSLVPLHESAIIALLLAVTASSRSAFFRILDWKPLTFLGTISYSLYVWQQPFAIMVHGRFMQPFAAVAMLFGVALISYYFLEEPSVKLGHKLAPTASLSSPTVSR